MNTDTNVTETIIPESDKRSRWNMVKHWIVNAPMIPQKKRKKATQKNGKTKQRTARWQTNNWCCFAIVHQQHKKNQIEIKVQMAFFAIVN